MEANQTLQKAFVTVDKRPRPLVVLPANSAGQVRTSRRPVQRLMEVQHLAELRLRLRVRPLRQVGEMQLHKAVYHPGGQVP